MVTVNTQDAIKWLLPFATALTAWGGFPPAPQFFKDLTKNEFFQYLMVFILVWQGGGQQDFMTAALTTMVMWVLGKVLSGGFGIGSCACPEETNTVKI